MNDRSRKRIRSTGWSRRCEQYIEKQIELASDMTGSRGESPNLPGQGNVISGDRGTGTWTQERSRSVAAGGMPAPEDAPLAQSPGCCPGPALAPCCSHLLGETIIPNLSL